MKRDVKILCGVSVCYGSPNTVHGTTHLKWLNVLTLSSNSVFVDDGKAVRSCNLV